MRLEYQANIITEKENKKEDIDLKNKKTTISLRSSLWKNINNKWQMIFHQGTLLK